MGCILVCIVRSTKEKPTADLLVLTGLFVAATLIIYYNKKRIAQMKVGGRKERE